MEFVRGGAVISTVAHGLAPAWRKPRGLFM
jgi:hypothetical protein